MIPTVARGLTSEQESVGRDFARALAGAPYIVRKAAYEAGLVESDLRNLNYGDADSLGALQERVSIYGRSHALSPLKTAQRFRSEAEALLKKGFHGDSGDLAAAVQRPRADLRGRYGLRGGEAAQLVKAFGGGGGSSSSADTPSGASPAAAGPAGVAQGSDGALALIQALSGQQSAPVASGGLAPPAASAAPPLPQGYQALQSGGGPVPKPDIGALLSAVQTVGGDVPQAPQTPGAPAGGSEAGASTPSGGGRVVLDPNADRAGARTHQAVLDFASKVSAIAGRPVRIGTGTNHSRMTVDGNVSEHWTGNAGDIPATGGRLIALGRAALVAAGMKPAQARRQTGGLFNVNGYQVIFNTHEGGDHTNHLHIGVGRAGR